MELDEADEMVPLFIPFPYLVTVNLTTNTIQVSQLDIEIQSIPQNVRSHYHTRLREAKAQLSKFKKALTDARSSLARADLLSSSKGGQYASSDDPYGSSSDRTRLLSGTALLENGTKRLEESQRMALETENQGAEILTNLRQQREQIENSRDTVRFSADFVSTVSLTLKCSLYEPTWQLTVLPLP
jgi:vesicle transport through interaction with t-SNAREs protein 1